MVREHNLLDFGEGVSGSHKDAPGFAVGTLVFDFLEASEFDSIIKSRCVVIVGEESGELFGLAFDEDATVCELGEIGGKKAEETSEVSVAVFGGPCGDGGPRDEIVVCPGSVGGVQQRESNSGAEGGDVEGGAETRADAACGSRRW